MLWGKSQMLVGVLEKGPSTHPPRTGHSTASAPRHNWDPGTQSHSQTSLWPETWCSHSLLAELLFCLGNREVA